MRQIHGSKSRPVAVLMGLALLGGGLAPDASAVARATRLTPKPIAAPAAAFHHTSAPTSVTVAGSLQSELGCPGDWQPECASTFLTYDANDDVWQGTFSAGYETAQPSSSATLSS